MSKPRSNTNSTDNSDKSSDKSDYYDDDEYDSPIFYRTTTIPEEQCVITKKNIVGDNCKRFRDNCRYDNKNPLFNYINENGENRVYNLNTCSNYAKSSKVSCRITGRHYYSDPNYIKECGDVPYIRGGSNKNTKFTGKYRKNRSKKRKTRRNKKSKK